MEGEQMNISAAACIGAGLIGQGWATVFAIKCRTVVLQDISKDRLALAVEKISKNLDFLEAHSLIDTDIAKLAAKRISTTVNIEEAVYNADYVQESIPDNYETKKKAFKTMGNHAPDHTILASSSSGLQMSEIQLSTKVPERCLLVHPFLPVHLMPCVEIAGGRQTAPETVNKATNFMEYVGKTPVVLNFEVPGHIVNRLQAAILREAMDLVSKGVASAEDVDKAFRLCVGIRDPIIGPLLRAHLAGDGIEHFINNYSQSYTYRWENMANWLTIPPSTAKSVVQGIHEMEIVRNKSLEEIKSWRNEKLVAILKILS
jgi:3-hydroxyacyl-CoA dehydrogenase